MRLALIPLAITPRKREQNFHRFACILEDVLRHQPDLICLPECAFTGYLYDESDLLEFAEPLDGFTISAMANLARRHGVFLAFGFLERTPDGVYDSAVVLNPLGEICLIHRKVMEQAPFLRGRNASVAETKLGKLGLLICGDLFHEEVLATLPRDVRLLLVPMSRGFDGRSPDVQRWESEERAAYSEAIRQAGVPTALVNSLEQNTPEGAFGGAMLVDAQGRVLVESPHGSDVPLIVSLQ
jgi:predicted amidohydrolase